MSFNEMPAELPGMTFGQRQMLIRCALELDDRSLDEDDETLVEITTAPEERNSVETHRSFSLSGRLRGF